ncbi:MAG: hypothetical protein K2J71_04700 [Oscillospiraceae bacterium]|nr:hypothetical protein [Oscillospiraceae bacterium]
MQTFKFFDTMPTMECLQGDTLETFQIHIESDSPENFTMQLILEDQKLLGTAKLTKNCTFSDGCFQAQLTSNDTAGLHGTYYMHFRLKNADGLSYRKLAGVLIVRPTVQGS